MKVQAALWFSSPGAHSEVKEYPSIQAVKEDFENMLDCYRKYGGSEPVGLIYQIDGDYPIWALEMTKRETLKMTRC